MENTTQKKFRPAAFIETCDMKYHVRVDYHTEFLKKAQAMDGAWDRRLKRWVFEWDHGEDIVDAIQDVFGKNIHIDSYPKTVDVRVTLTEDVSCACTSITLFKRMVATAVGRKTIDGAVLGEGIILEKGGFFSGGCESWPSNPDIWATKGSKGTTFIFQRTSDVFIERHRDSNFEIEVLSEWDPVIEKILKDGEAWKPKLV